LAKQLMGIASLNSSYGLAKADTVPNLDFYAVGADFDAVLDYVFRDCACRVFESYSPPGEEIAEFYSTAEVSARYPIGTCRSSGASVLLQLVPPSATALFSIRRVALSPDVDQRHTVRYAVAGWGLIQLYLGGEGPHGLVASHTNHNTESRARRWQDLHRELGSVENWNWPEITRVSSGFNRFIRTKLAVSRIGSRPVLPNASEAISKGAQLVGTVPRTGN
jgi:hypothetical protein